MGKIPRKRDWGTPEGQRCFLIDLEEASHHEIYRHKKWTFPTTWGRLDTSISSEAKLDRSLVKAQLKNPAKFCLYSCSLLFSSLEVKKLLSLKCLEFQINVPWKVYTKMICFFKLVHSWLFLVQYFVYHCYLHSSLSLHGGFISGPTMDTKICKCPSPKVSPLHLQFFSCRFNLPQIMKYYSI